MDDGERDLRLWRSVDDDRCLDRWWWWRRFSLLWWAGWPSCLFGRWCLWRSVDLDLDLSENERVQQSDLFCSWLMSKRLVDGGSRKGLSLAPNRNWPLSFLPPKPPPSRRGIQFFITLLRSKSTRIVLLSKTDLFASWYASLADLWEVNVMNPYPCDSPVTDCNYEYNKESTHRLEIIVIFTMISYEFNMRYISISFKMWS